MIYIDTVIYVLLSFSEVTNAINTKSVGYHHRRQKRQRSNGEGFQFVDCVLPAHPENGKWQVIGGSKEPGSIILPNTLIKFSCNAGYTLTPKNAFYICNDDWNPKTMPKCQETTCTGIKSTLTSRVECTDSDGKAISCDRAQHGSTATMNCAKYYELPVGHNGETHCKEGNWSNILPQCVPVCGEPVGGKKDKVNGIINDSIFKYPWIATLYLRHNDELQYICGGNIISESVILTAAHCVSNYNADSFQPRDLQISVGKAYHVYGDLRDQSAQYVLVKEIKLHPQYKGDVQNYISDLAVLKTKTPIRMSALVQPVCFKGVNNITLPNGAKGVFALWGQKANGDIPEGLKYFEILNNQQACEKEIRKEWADKYNLPDKRCALLKNEGNETLCKGFSGAGWAFKNPTDNRYYIHGIVSLAPRNIETMCSDPTVLCTKVSTYYDFIANQLDAP